MNLKVSIKIDDEPTNCDTCRKQILKGHAIFQVDGLFTFDSPYCVGKSAERTAIDAFTGMEDILSSGEENVSQYNDEHITVNEQSVELWNRFGVRPVMVIVHTDCVGKKDNQLYNFKQGNIFKAINFYTETPEPGVLIIHEQDGTVFSIPSAYVQEFDF